MDYKTELISTVEKFYLDVVEEFKEAELKIMADSQFRSIFRKKDYAGNIERLRICKKEALKIDTRGIPISDKDEAASDITRQLDRCLAVFNNLCDAYIQLQTALKKKSEKEELKFSAYKEIFNKVKNLRGNLNSALHELDIIYTDYTYDEEDDKWEMQTL